MKSQGDRYPAQATNTSDSSLMFQSDVPAGQGYCDTIFTEVITPFQFVKYP